jgi:homoserine/homoserine lactone efflux protein
VTRRRLVLRGWAVNAVNPKGTVSMLAVVPQFLDLARVLNRIFGGLLMGMAALLATFKRSL